MASIINMANSSALRKAQTWLGMLAALVLVAALLLNLDPRWYWPGLIVSVAGLVMQVWVFGSIRSRRLLPVNGPYRFVRNPAYIAHFVYMLGFVLMAGNPWLLIIYVPVYCLFAAYRVGKEEELLEEKFSTEYLRYCKEVPRFIPHLKPYGKGRAWFFSMKHFKRQYGEILVLLSAVLYVACYIAAFNPV